MPTFPAALPLPVQDGFTETLPKNMLRTEMGQGPAKVRRRSTANVRPLSVTLILSTAEVATFETFFVTTVASGVTSFDYTHPRTSATVTARFTGEPVYNPTSGNNWTVTFGLEILP